MSAPDARDAALPTAYRRTVLDLAGAAGAAWLDGLPGLVGDVSARWWLRTGPPYPLGYGYVVPADLPDGTPAVLKLGPPGDSDGLAHEATALRLADGDGAVRLLEHDEERRALLLERAVPGRPVAALVPADDETATTVLAAALRRFQRPVPPGTPLRELAEWLEDLPRHRHTHDGAGPLPADLFGAAVGLAEELLAGPGPAVLLHGDLHHDNVLSAGREPWLVIDPKGLLGPSGYDVGALLYNPLDVLRPLPDPDLAALVRRRVDVLSDQLGMNPQEVRAWGLVQGVLSAVWSLQDTDGPDTLPLRVARLLA